MFAGLAVLCLIAGIGFLLVCLILWFVAWRELQVLTFGIAMLFGGLANYFAFTVLHHMASAGYKVGTWRTYKDFGLYSEYWNIAPQKQWSRLPIVGFVLCFCLAACFLFSTLFLPAH